MYRNLLKTTTTLAFVTASISTLADSLSDVENKEIHGWYLGGSLGYQTNEFVEDFNNNCTGECADDNSVNVAFIYGYDFNENLAFEGGVNISSYDYDYDYYNGYYSDYYNGTVYVYNLTLAAKGSLDFGKLRPFGKFGINVTSIYDDSYDGYDTETETGALLGLGVDYKFTDSVIGRVSYERSFLEFYDQDSDISTLSLGIMYHF